MREGKYPKKEEKGRLGEVTYTHPAFGTIRVNRANGTERRLFGSEIKHHQTVTLEICHAEENRFLSGTNYYGHNKVVEIEMSYSQFAEMMTSFGSTGVPCTIRYTEKDLQTPAILQEETKDQTFHAEFEAHLEEAQKYLSETMTDIQRSLDEKKNLTMKDRQQLLKKLTQVQYNVSNNLEFVTKQYDRYMNTVKWDAKSEVEAFFQERAMYYGLNTEVETPILLEMEGKDDEVS